MIRLTSPVTITGSAGQSRRIEGIAVPYGTVAHASTGPVMFLDGSLPLDGPAPKLIRDHDSRQPIGIVDSREVVDGAIRFGARISSTPAGDEALTLAMDGVLDAVSVGANPTESEWIDGVQVVARAEWIELSLVPWGAFPGAVVDAVYATPAEDPATDPEDPITDPEESENTDMTTEPAVEAATIPTAPLHAARPTPQVTAAQYLAGVASGNLSPAIRAVIAEQGTGDTPGILPETLTGTVYSNLNSRRPLIAAIGARAMPSAGTVFLRRKITQHVDVDEQAAEFDELASQKMTITPITVTKKTVGGVVALSEQELDWTDPAALGLVLDDFARMYAYRTETLACSGLVTAASVTDEITDFTDGDEILDALYDASATIADGVDELPTHLFVSTDRWADLGKAKTANGDRIFPIVAPSNAAGTMTPGSFAVSGLGLTVVVSPRFAAETMILGNPVGFELYEQNKGAIRVEVPETLSTKLAWRGYFATATITADAFVAFVPPA